MARVKKDWEAEFKALQKEARKLAKRANQRMVRIERLSESADVYSEVKDFSYAVAQRNIRALYAKTGDRLRFTESPKLETEISDGTRYLEGDALYRANVLSLQQKIKAMETFLASKTSTKTGVDIVLDKRTNTINTAEKFGGLEKLGLSYSKDELKRFFENKKQEKLQKAVGSHSMFIVSALIRKNKIGSSKRELEKFLKNNINMKDIKKAADQEGMTVKQMLSEKNYEDRDEMLDKLWGFVKLTGDEQLNNYVKKALKEGINYKNLFI